MKNREGKPAIAQDHGVKGPRSWHYPMMLAIDPGDVHVGVAEFIRIDGIWTCTWAHEYTPDTFLPWFVEGIRSGKWERVLLESWKLFPEAAKLYVGSDMPTSRLIGAIKAIAAFCAPEGAWFDEAPKVILQDPQIKVPTRSMLRRRKLRSVAKILGIPLDHAADAELHGYKWLFDNKERMTTVVEQDRYWAGTRDLSPRHSIW